MAEVADENHLHWEIDNWDTQQKFDHWGIMGMGEAAEVLKTSKDLTKWQPWGLGWQGVQGFNGGFIANIPMALGNQLTPWKNPGYQPWHNHVKRKFNDFSSPQRINEYFITIQNLAFFSKLFSLTPMHDGTEGWEELKK